MTEDEQRELGEEISDWWDEQIEDRQEALTEKAMRRFEKEWDRFPDEDDMDIFMPYVAEVVQEAFWTETVSSLVKKGVLDPHVRTDGEVGYDLTPLGLREVERFDGASSNT